ncbi:MAG: oligosaccharide flippase family protein [Clostridia bacterium]|nr:oligosaccharide flippase family protein [Clostridia bacterium]
MKKQSFFYGAAVLAAASILCKIMSAALKIPLDRFFLHEDGIGVYQSAYTVYNVFLAICVTGIPVALSSLVASSDREGAASLTKSTLWFVSVLGVLFGGLMFAFAQPLARLLSGGGSPMAEYSLKILSLSLPFMGIISSRRGYFQGMGIMTPSAISQLLESLIKVILGIGICAISIKWGIAQGAAGAICGVTLGALASAGILEIFYRKSKSLQGSFSIKMAMQVIKVSIPMTLGAFGFTAVMLTDALTVPNLLSAIGVSEAERLKMFGYLTRANTIYNLPATIITAFTASAVPAIAAARKSEDRLRENTLRGVKLIFLAALPSAFGMMLFSGELLLLLYSSSLFGELLVITGVMVFVMPYIQATTAILQTLQKVWTPIFITAGALILKAVLNSVFVKSMGVIGAPLASVVAFLPAMVLNTLLLSRQVNLSGGGKIFFKMLFCAAISCGGGRLLYMTHQSTLMLLVSVAFAAVVYFLGIVALKCVTKEDLSGKEKE